MIERRGSRFVLEVLFLAALAAGVTLAHLTPLEIVGAMALGWLIMAALEWASWRGEAHYGSGLPPRYFVPRTSLPPPQPLEQVAQSDYPEQREEAPTWIAPPALRAEMLGEWPHAAAPEGEPVAPWPAPAAAEADETDAGVVPLPPVPVAEPEPEIDPVVARPAEPELVPAPEFASTGPPDAAVDQAAPVEAAAPEPEPEPLAAPAAPAVSRHSLDPLAEPPPKRRFGRRRGDEVPAVEVPARPTGPRALPRRAARQD
ncbi:MAG TPA: hypothetical protein VFA05_11160 [Gaiellaceae bacterium]|nr:hypothetical protein [Gaiellaceae bacterium]